MTDICAQEVSTQQVTTPSQEAASQLVCLTDMELACVGGGNLVANF